MKFRKYCKKTRISYRHGRMWQIERYKVAGKLSSKLVLVERSNPTYNSVQLQEGKLCVAETQIHVHIWCPQAPASMDYTDGTASGVTDDEKSKSRAKLLASRWFDSTPSKKKHSI